MLIKIANDISELGFSSNQIAVAEAGGKKICIGRFNDRLFAFAYLCPHAGGLLAQGYIDSRGNVVCPMHGYRFDCSNGRNVSGEGFHLRHWEVSVNEEGVFVKI